MDRGSEGTSVAASGPRVSRLRTVGVEVASAIAYLILGGVGSLLGLIDGQIVWYPAAGLALGLGVTRGWRAAPALMATHLAAVLIRTQPDPPQLLLVGLASLAYPAVYVGTGVLIDRHFRPGSDPTKWRLGALVATTMVVAPFAGALLAAIGKLGLGTVGWADIAPAIPVRMLADSLGVASVSVTLGLAIVRRRKGERWWAMPGLSLPSSLVLAILPAAAALALGRISGDALPFTAAVLLPMFAIAVARGLTAVSLAAPWAALALTSVASSRLSSDVLRATDIMLALLIGLAASFWAAAITEQRAELSRRLTEGQRHLDRAQKLARTGSYRWRLGDDLVSWSDGMFELLGTDRRPVTVAGSMDVVHPEDIEQVRTIIRDCRDHGRRGEATYRLVRPDGEALIVRAHIEPRWLDGEVVEVAGSVTDVTREEQARQKLSAAFQLEHEASQTRDAATLELARTERIKDALLIAVSHEVRTPLTMVRGIAETLARPEVADDRLGDHTEHLRSLDRHTTRLQTVLTDLLDVDRIGRGVVDPVRRLTELAPLITDVISDLGMLERTAIDVFCPPVTVDPRFAARIVEHLLSNAGRHASPGSKITVRAWVLEETVELVVENDGETVSPDERERVFGMFEQADVVAHKPGTGVGLFLVAKFAELHGGRAWMTYGPDGQGTAVHVTLGTSEPS